MKSLEERLSDYDRLNAISSSKGKLCVMLLVSRLALKEGLPLDPNVMLTDAKGQVAGLGKTAIQNILNDHGEKRVLAEEGGRTSRGSIKCMESYVSFLNDLYDHGFSEVKCIENWWVERVRGYFSGKPFKIKLDSSKSIGAILTDLVLQAQKRQEKISGATYVGALIQHLIGAKLDIMFPGMIKHHGYSVADASTERGGDYMINNASIHVTVSPTESLMRKCLTNIESGYHPIVITSKKGISAAEVLSSNINISDRIDLFDYNQFLSAHIYDAGMFSIAEEKKCIIALVERYNAIISSCETDPSLRIEIA